MTTIGSVCANACSAPKPGGDSRLVGVEIEVETCPMLPPFAGWRVVPDGSLRNGGAELVSSPLPNHLFRSYLEPVYSYLWIRGTSTSVRTGIHVHVDVRDFSKQDLAAFLAAYCLAEPALFQAAGPTREECIYCVPWYRADSDLEAFVTVQNRDMDVMVSSLEQLTCKYSALYLEPLGRFGTVEFRHAPTWRDARMVDSWVQACASLVEFSKGKTAEGLLAAWSEGGGSFLESALGAPFVRDCIDVPMYAYSIETLDCDFNAARIAGIKVRDDAWVRTLGSVLPPPSEEPQFANSLPFMEDIDEEELEDFVIYDDMEDEE